MSDDSFIREVDEELRHDQLRNIWNRFGNYLIGAAVLVVLLTAGYRGWEYYTASRAAQSGDLFLQAIDAARDGRHDAAILDLEALAETGSGQYPALARMRLAGALADKGEIEQALAAYDAIAGDDGFDPAFRTVAQLRAGYLAVDHKDYAEVQQRLGSLAEPGQPYRSLAREALGLSALKGGDANAAAEWFQQIVDDSADSGGIKARARIMLDLLAGRGVTAAS